MARVLLVAYDSEQYRLLTWALRDDGIDARCLPPAQIEYGGLHAFDAIVVAMPEEPAADRRALIDLIRARCGRTPIADVIEGDAAADTGADRYITNAVGHEDIMRMLRAAQQDAPPRAGDAQT